MHTAVGDAMNFSQCHLTYIILHYSVSLRLQLAQNFTRLTLCKLIKKITVLVTTLNILFNVANNIHRQPTLIALHSLGGKYKGCHMTSHKDHFN